MRIAAYCRVSTGSDEQLESLKNQEIFFKEYAKNHGYDLINIYSDEGISGKQAINRKQFLKMIEDAEYDLFDTVVVKDISRFARNTVDFLNAIRKLKSINIEVQFLSNNQTILGSSEFILTIFSALAQEESANLSKRVKFGKRINAEKGRVPNFIYGYDKVDTFTLKINPQEAKAVKMIYDMYLEGTGSRLIALRLTELKIPSKHNASMWSPKTVRRILMNPIFSGVLVNNKSESKDYLTGTKLKHTPDQYYYHERPELQIIQKEQFEKVQEQIRERQRIYENENPGGRFSNRHIFSNLIQCSQCGSSYGRIKQTYKNTYVRWRCTGNNNYTSKFCDNTFKIDESELITNILEYFTNIISNKDKFIEDLKKDAQKHIIQNSTETEMLSEQIARIEKLREKFKSMYTNDIIDIDELKTRNEELKQQQSELDHKYSTVRIKENEIQRIENIAFDKYGKIQSMLNSKTMDNAILREIIEKITVNKDGQVHIYIKK